MLKKNGVYVLLGGAGGLGKVTSEYLIKTYQAQVIWLGRSAISPELDKALDEMANYGKRPIYLTCDATDRASVERATSEIRDQFEIINGLFHSAIVLNDKLIQNMSEDDFLKSFDAKTIASKHFVEAFDSYNLDFICFYSSLQALTHSAGQANYAAGCAYKDSYASWLNDLGKTKSFTINWGYWGEVGVVASEDYRKKMASIGVGSISQEEGMKILETVLNSDHQQLIALKTS